ncbi:hypothetical protein BN1708_018665, partial [Verticillium longisporum]
PEEARHGPEPRLRQPLPGAQPKGTLTPARPHHPPLALGLVHPAHVQHSLLPRAGPLRRPRQQQRLVVVGHAPCVPRPQGH